MSDMNEPMDEKAMSEDAHEYDGPCEAGCLSFHGGEKRHHPTCGHYPHSLTKYNAERIKELEAQVAGLLRVVTDNHVALTRAEEAEAQLKKYAEPKWGMAFDDYTEAIKRMYADGVKAARLGKPADAGEMKTPRLVDDFPKKGNHIGDLIRLPSGQVYEWIGRSGDYTRWSRNYSRENE